MAFFSGEKKVIQGGFLLRGFHIQGIAELTMEVLVNLVGFRQRRRLIPGQLLGQVGELPA